MPSDRRLEVGPGSGHMLLRTRSQFYCDILAI